MEKYSNKFVLGVVCVMLAAVKPSPVSPLPKGATLAAVLVVGVHCSIKNHIFFPLPILHPVGLIWQEI